MRTILIAVALLGACGSDEPIDPTPDAAALACKSSTLPETAPEWTACRRVDINSFPVFCEDGAQPTACDFEADIDGGGVAICRLPGGCP